MRQIVSVLIAVAVFAGTFFLTTLLADFDIRVKIGGMSLVGTIPGLILAGTFAVMSYRGSGKG